MGGEGSGRKPDPVKLLYQQNQTNPNVVSNMIIPNHSGDHSAGNLQRTPTRDIDIVNKKYVDDQIAGISIPEDQSINILYTNMQNCKLNGKTGYKIHKGFVDGYADQVLIDDVTSTNETYNSGGKYYHPSTSGGSFPANCIHYYNLDSDFTDQVGTNDLTSAGSPSNTTGLINNGYNFPDGNYDYAYYGSVDFMGGDYTLSGWVKTSNNQGILIWFDGSPNLWIMINASGYPYFHTNNGQDLYGSTSVADGSWHHLAMSNSSGTITCYVDGSSIGTLGSTGTSFNNYCLGTWYNNPGYNPANNLLIDEVGIFDRALSGTEISTLYNSGAGLTYGGGGGGIQDMTLISEDVQIKDIPSTMRLVLEEEDVDSVTLNTDLIAYVSRDGGTHYDDLTLTEVETLEDGKRLLSAELDVTGQDSDNTLKYKIETFGVDLKIHGAGVLTK